MYVCVFVLLQRGKLRLMWGENERVNHNVTSLFGRFLLCVLNYAINTALDNLKLHESHSFG